MLSFLKKIVKINPIVISIITVLIGTSAYLNKIPFLELMELKTIDLRFISRGKISPGPNVVLAVADEKSIDKEGKWMWPRSKFAKLVTKLSDAGARVIAFDVGFHTPDDKGIIKTIDNIQKEFKKFDIKNKSLEYYLENLKSQSDNDKLLADAIQNSKAKVVIGYFFYMDISEAVHMDAMDEKEIDIHEKNIQGSRYRYILYTSENAQNIKLIEAIIPESTIMEISRRSDYSGFYNINPDRDGVVRKLSAVFKFKDMLYAPLSLMALSAYLDSQISIKAAEYGIEELRIGDMVIPTDEMGRIFINHRGPPKTFPHISITDILNNNIPKDFLKGKIVIVGVTAIGAYDIVATPFEPVFPGPEVHANIIDSILSKDFMFQPAWAAIFDIMAIIITGLFLGFLLPRTGVILGAVVSASLFAGYILLCQYLFTEKGSILNLVYPLSVMIIIYVVITAYKYLVEAKQKRFVKDAFSTYLAPAVVKQIIDSPEKLVLGGEERVITAFFSDVQNFTSIAEKLTPHELVELLNEFLTEMTDIILDHEGTVDKFEGDAVIALFGAPNELENHAATACRACIEMQKRLSELRVNWKELGKPELFMRIGLCSGQAVVGNMGSKNRMDYTMMGDTVNTAARLEGVNKLYGSYTLISETTHSLAGGSVLTREIDSINVFGKEESVTIYQLIGYPEFNDEKVLKAVDFYHKGLYTYRKREWSKAIKFFEATSKLMQNDGPSKTMLARCHEHKVNPPGKDWNGAFTMTTK
jgi:adenylate cyclase